MFRIPAIIVTKSGKILAFCEGRKSIRDHCNADIVMKTSSDNGITWSCLKVIWNDGENTCGNPAPVFDQITGEVIVAATLNNDKVFVLRSKDEGITWESPIGITPSVKPEHWKWYATGPVHAIQIETGAYKNRIVVPCNHTESANGNHFSHTIYSDDHGNTWLLGGIVFCEKTDECTVAELVNGDLLLNMRNNDKTLAARKTSISHDGGISWSVVVFDTTLIDPVCQGSLLRYSFTPDILLFTNNKHKHFRRNLTLSVSYNGGKIWAKQISIFAKKTAYSDMVVLSNGDVLCIFETGRILPYGGIVCSRIKKDW